MQDVLYVVLMVGLLAVFALLVVAGEKIISLDAPETEDRTSEATRSDAVEVTA